ncbi:MAG: aldehyde dehydrogenase family protein [Deltaproteobacteria bacterium]|nr:aldehyde dehydrogenase family protein [Deltaproteobacteria bacterium]
MNLTTFRQFTNEPVVNPWADAAMKPLLTAGIEKARAILHSKHQLFIDGKWIDGDEGTFTTTNPNDRNETYGPFPVASVRQTEAALAAAKKAYPAWSARPSSERARIMRDIRKKFVDEKWTLMGLMMLEIGKTGIEAYAEWAEAVDFLEYYANSCELFHNDEFLAVTALAGHKTRLNPKSLGLGVSLPPFNFPCAIFTGMWAAPTVMGNVMVVKPSPRAPSIGTFCAKLFAEAGAPVELVVEGGKNNHAISRTLIESPDVAIITFTGSQKAGMEINLAAALTSTRWIKRVVAEMGGCDFIAVHDFDDIAKVVDAVQASATGFQGQKCSALSRLIVKEDLYDHVKAALIEKCSSIRLKNTIEADSILGGVIDERSKQSIADQCAEVVNAGGKFLLGGKADENYPGYGIPLSIHEGLVPDSDAAKMEIFGPVFGLYKAKDFDELVRIANVTPYALTGSLFTQRPELQARLHEFTSGNTYLNRKCTGAFVGAEPFGGWYGSGTDDKAGHWSHMLRFIQWQTISEKVG